MHRTISALFFLLPITVALAADVDYRCPVYSAPQRLDDQARIQRELELRRMACPSPSRQRIRSLSAASISTLRATFPQWSRSGPS